MGENLKRTEHKATPEEKMFSGWQKTKSVTKQTPQVVTESPKAKPEGAFGIPIERDGDAPPILSQFIRYLQTKGVVEKIFQMAPPEGRELQTLRKKLKTEASDIKLLSSYTKNPHVIAELTKELLLSLPEPLTTFDMYDRFMLLILIKHHEHRMMAMKNLIAKIPKGFHSSLSMVLRLLSSIATSAVTNTDANVLAEIFTPCFLRPNQHVFYQEGDKESATLLVSLLISEYEYLFKNTRLKTGPDLGPPLMMAPTTDRQQSIRYMDIANTNPHKKPIFYLQAVKAFKDSQQPAESPSESSTIEPQPSQNDKTPDHLDDQNQELLDDDHPEGHEEDVVEEEDLEVEDKFEESSSDLEEVEEDKFEESESDLEDVEDKFEESVLDDNMYTSNPKEESDAESMHMGSDLKDDLVLDERTPLSINSSPMLAIPKQISDSGDFSNEFELIQPEPESDQPDEPDSVEDVEEDTFDDVAVSALLPNSNSFSLENKPE